MAKTKTTPYDTVDYLKTEAPFWKKEQTAEGERWVKSRSSDDQARARWTDKQ